MASLATFEQNVLQDTGCDPHQVVTGKSLVSSAHSAQSSNHSSIVDKGDGSSCITPVAPVEDQDGAKKATKKKKKDKDKKIKVDENGNQIKKKKKSKAKENENLVGIPISQQKELQRKRLGVVPSEEHFLSQTDELDEFETFFVEHIQKQAPVAPGERNSDVFPFEKCSHQTSPHFGIQCLQPPKASYLQKAPARTEGTVTTIASTESYPPPPVTTVEVYHDVERYDDDDEITLETMDNRGHLLQTFLRRNGHDDELALQTAMAFQSFLQNQRELMATTTGIDSSSQRSDSKASSTGISQYDDEDSFERHQKDKMKHEREFSLRDGWDAGSFVSHDDHLDRKPAAVSRKQFTEPANDNEWTKIRRNETFMRGKLGDGEENTYSAARPRNMVAATQRSIVTQSHPLNPLIPIPQPPPMTPLQYYNDSPLTRKAPVSLRSYQQQMSSLSIEQRSCVIQLKTKWEERADRGNKPLPDEWFIRFAKCSPGKPFDYTTAWKIMKKFDYRYLDLSILSMERQLLTKTLFPCPGLKSKSGYDMFYMKPSRYFPKKTSVTTVIDNLVYVMECMLDDERTATDGVGFIANMTDWRMANFSVPYCHKFMMTLQGRRVPTRVGLFLIVNPPAWFGSIWAIMKPMLSEGFRKKVYMISFHAMALHLAPGYERYLPDDIYSGMASTNAIVQKFIADRKVIESFRMLQSR